MGRVITAGAGVKWGGNTGAGKLLRKRKNGPRGGREGEKTKKKVDHDNNNDDDDDESGGRLTKQEKEKKKLRRKPT